MALSEQQIKEIKNAGATFMFYNRPPVEVRKELDLGYRIENQSVYVFEIRPRWDKPEEILHEDVAKTTYVKTQGVWKVYWMRGDLKWHRYGPQPEVATISEFFDLVAGDDYACFFG